MSDLPDRPLPRRPLGEHLRQWVQWVGVGRLVAGASAMLAVLAGAYWLVRPPAATTETTLPYAPGAGGTPTVVATVLPDAGVVPSSTAPDSTERTVAPEVVVHVAGAVNVPGVYRLPEGARVVDALAAAGGVTAAADNDVVNLAALVHDGERLFVPAVGQAVPEVVAGTGGAGPGGGSGAGSGGGGDPSTAGPVNINTATADELDALPGVGPSTAAAIIAHRDANGPFSSVDQLADVRGIGPAKLEALRGLVTV